MTLFGSAFAVLSIAVSLRRVQYDSKVLNSIRIDEAPIPIVRMLSETTNKGILINQVIIRTISEKRGLSQTDLYAELPISTQLCPTKEMVRQYVKKLEKEDIIRDMAGQLGEAKRKAYVLTKKGQWCVRAIQRYYPTYYVSFLIRDVLRTRLRKRLPSFDSIVE